MKNRCLSRVRKLYDSHTERTLRLFDARTDGLEQSVGNGTMRKILEVAVPVSIGITASGIINYNDIVTGIGFGSLVMEEIYSLILRQ